ncbi:hypothetical protein QCA50_003468 [Cerrena zonata]|uniref:Uncharacterized protein n=1 Tax=Cerrena zonata TaxID=2478898 RepID=A0AAW0GWF1_9APHY
MATLPSLLLFSCALLAMGAPIDEELDSLSEEEPSHLDKTWEIVLGVVVSLVVCAVIGTAVWVRIRRRRRQQTTKRRTSGSTRNSTADLGRTQEERKRPVIVNEDVISVPSPTLAKNQPRRGPYR